MDITQDNNIEVFGNPAGAQPQQPETPESKETPEVQPAETQTEQKAEVKTPEQPAEKKPEQPEQKKDEPEFKVTFGDEKTEKVETPDLKDEQVLEYLKKKGYEINSFDELKKPELPEQIQKALQYTKETGRGLQDFLKAQQDWTKAPKEQTIKEYYRTKYPNFTNEQIQAQIDLIRVTDEDKEELSEREIKQMELEFAKVYSEALNFMQEQQKKYFVPEQQPQRKELSDEEIAKMYQPYWNERDKSLENLKEFKIGLGNLGDIKIKIKDEYKKEIAKYTQTQEAFFKQWTDETGKVNTDNLTLDMLFAIKPIREKLLTQMFEQANMLFMEKHSKVNRNVDLNDDIPDTPQTEQKGKFEIIGERQSEFHKSVI